MKIAINSTSTLYYIERDALAAILDAGKCFAEHVLYPRPPLFFTMNVNTLQTDCLDVSQRLSVLISHTMHRLLQLQLFS